jgi:hypothetical protein
VCGACAGAEGRARRPTALSELADQLPARRRNLSNDAQTFRWSFPSAEATLTTTWGTPLRQMKPRALATPHGEAAPMQPDLLEYGNDYLTFIRRHPPFGSATELIAAYQRELEQRRQEQVASR